MKTTHKKALEAYLTITQMGNIRRAQATSLKLFRLKKLLQPAFEFVGEEEKKLIDEFGGTVTETGQVLFEDKGKQTEYNAERKKLLELECDVELEKKVIIRAEEMKEISLAEMEALDDFIDFYER